MDDFMVNEMPRIYKKLTNDKGWVRVDEAARILQRTPHGVRKMLADGRLRGEQHAGPNSMWFVDPESIQKILDDNRG